MILFICVPTKKQRINLCFLSTTIIIIFKYIEENKDYDYYPNPTIIVIIITSTRVPSVVVIPSPPHKNTPFIVLYL